MIRHMMSLGGVVLVAAVVGCSSQTPTDTSTTGAKPSAEGAKYLVSAAPDDPRDVIAMREDARNDEEVVVIGRIGGSQQPWIDGLAAFTLVDRSLAACSDIPGDKCPTPWDYCCETDKLPGSTTLVKVVDEQGRIVPTGARELLGVSELQTVVVKGKAQKDDAGNVTILAHEIFVDPSNPGLVHHGDVAGDHAHHDHDHDHDHGHDHGDDHDHADHDDDHDDDHDHGHDHDKDPNHEAAETHADGSETDS